jgi:RimJ/RimL family protein N-acetyltransferase
VTQAGHDNLDEQTSESTTAIALSGAGRAENGQMSTALATQRLLLRLPVAGDASAAAELLTDPEVMRFLGGEVVPEKRVGAVVEKWIWRWEENGIGFFVVENCEDGAFLGRIGLNVWDVRSWTHATLAGAREYAQPELGWALVRSQWGRGYATEAALAVRDWAFKQRDIRHLISLIAPDNLASAAVARRLGASPTQEVKLFDCGHAVVWEHPRW